MMNRPSSARWVTRGSSTPRLSLVLRGEDGVLQAVKVDAVGADTVADVAHIIHALGAIEHVEQPIVMEDPAVEHVQGLPFVERVGLEDRICGMTL